MKAFVIYTLARLGLFVASYAVVVTGYVLLAGPGAVPTLWPLLVAIVVSSIASVYLLRRQREQLAASVARRASAASQRMEAARSKEDEPDR